MQAAEYRELHGGSWLPRSQETAVDSTETKTKEKEEEE
jgi:hypothetical protein